MVDRATPPIIDIDNLSVVFPSDSNGGDITALKGINLKVWEGEFVSLIGPSGCGKSTLLRIAADLLPPTNGVLRIEERLPREIRRMCGIGMVFQDAALLEWRNILDNVVLPLELKHVARKERYAEAKAMLDMVGLTGFETAYPRQLSGGMKQRAAIARAMVTHPKILLLDEPFGALDQITRDRLNLELLEIVERQQMTILLVTHSIREAIFLSDRVAVITERPGRICDIVEVPIARPRSLENRETSQFNKLVSQGAHSLQSGMSQ